MEGLAGEMQTLKILRGEGHRIEGSHFHRITGCGERRKLPQTSDSTYMTVSIFGLNPDLTNHLIGRAHVCFEQ